jgi:hypothetical protein
MTQLLELGQPSARSLSYATFIDAHRRAILLLSIVLAVGSAVLASKLSVEGDFSHLLPPSEQSVQHLRKIEARTRSLSTFMVGVESDDPALREKAALALHARILKLDKGLGVTYDDRVAYQYAYRNRFMLASMTDLEAARAALQKRLLEANPLGVSLEDEDEPADAGKDAAKKDAPKKDPVEDLETRLAELKAKADYTGGTVSPDKKLQMIIVRTGFASDSSAGGEEMLAMLEGAIAQTKAEFPAVTFGMAGDVITSLAEHRTLLDGMLISTLATIALVMAALLLFYRSFTGVMALLWSLAVGACLTFGFTKLSVGHLNLASAFLSSIVIGNGINFGIILLARYMEERRAGREGLPALAGAIGGTIGGTLAASLTAAVAYGSLAFTDFRGFRDFGIIGGVGMIFCWIAAYTVFPAALASLDRHGLLKAREELPVGRWVTKLMPANPAPFAFAGLALLAGLSVATVKVLSTDYLEDDLHNLRSYSDEISKAGIWMAKFDRGFGQGISGGFIVAAPKVGEAFAVAEKLRSIDKDRPAKQKLFSHIATLEDLLPKEQPEKIAKLAEIRSLVDKLPAAERAKIGDLRPPEDLRPLGYDDLPFEIAWPFTEKDGTRGRFALANTGPGVDLWNTKALEMFATTVRGLGLAPDVLVGGSAFVFTDMLFAMQRDGPRATLAALIGSVLVVLLLVGFGRYAAVTIVSGALGVLAMLVAGWAFGLKVNFLDFVALPITIGIGIDYAVNIAARARQFGGAGEGRLSLSTTGGAVMLCSYTTIVGYASLLFSKNRGIHTFGFSAMLGELTCLTAALFIAPALLDFFGRAKVAKPVAEP